MEATYQQLSEMIESGNIEELKLVGKEICFTDMEGKHYIYPMNCDEQEPEISPAVKPGQCFTLYINKSLPEEYEYVVEFIKKNFVPLGIESGLTTTTFVFENPDKSQAGGIQFFNNFTDEQKWRLDPTRLLYTEYLKPTERKSPESYSTMITNILTIDEDNERIKPEPGDECMVYVEKYKPCHFEEARDLSVSKFTEAMIELNRPMIGYFFENPEKSERGLVQIWKNPFDIERWIGDCKRKQINKILQPMRERPFKSHRFKITEIINC